MSAGVILRPRITHAVSFSGPASFTNACEIDRSGASAQVKNTVKNPPRSNGLPRSKPSKIHTKTHPIALSALNKSRNVAVVLIRIAKRIIIEIDDKAVVRRKRRWFSVEIQLLNVGQLEKRELPFVKRLAWKRSVGMTDSCLIGPHCSITTESRL
jgi:hypothetical protein